MSKQALIQFVEDQIVVKDFPKFKTGDTITVTYKIIEGQKERLQKFQGIVLKRSGHGKTGTFTIRKISNNIRNSRSDSFTPTTKEKPRLLGAFFGFGILSP